MGVHANPDQLILAYGAGILATAVRSARPDSA